MCNDLPRLYQLSMAGVIAKKGPRFLLRGHALPQGLLEQDLRYSLQII